MKKTVAIIGNGRWAKVYKENITRKNNLCAVYFNEVADFVVDFDILIGELARVPADVFVIATHPKVQIRYLEFLLTSSRAIIIIEKPIVVDKVDLEIFQNLLRQYGSRIIANLPCVFNDDVRHLRLDNILHDQRINKVVIYEMGNGPYRRTLSPFLDWFPHVYAMMSTLGVSAETLDFLRKDVSHKGVQYEMRGLSKENLQIYAYFGNGFDSKKRGLEFVSNTKMIISLDLTKSYDFERSPIFNLLEAAFKKCSNPKHKVYWPSKNDEEFIWENAYFCVHFNDELTEVTYAQQQ
jgi:predicted dehydrogenase